MLFIYVRHGAPIYDPDSLTPLGHRQAEAVGKRLALYGLDRIYASTSALAIQTAKPAAELLGKEITELDFANEGHAWRDLTAMTDSGKRDWAFDIPRYKKLFLSNEIRSLGKEWYKHPAFSDTDFEKGIERIRRESDAFFASLGYEHDCENNCFNAVRPNDERVAMFAHGGFGFAFISHILDIPYPMFATKFDMCHSGMTVIDFSGNDVVYPRLLQYSSDSHLYKEGIMTGYNNRIRF